MWLTIPNLFTFLRVLMTPWILAELAGGHFIESGWIFGGAAITDMLDGAVARRFGGESKIGLYLDPIADKLLLTAIYAGLALGKAIPLWLLAVIFGRDLWILLLSGIALKFTEYRDLQPSVWGKASTFLQIATAIGVMAARGYEDRILERISAVLMLSVAAVAVISACDYSMRGIHWLRTRSAGPAGVDLRGGRE